MDLENNDDNIEETINNNKKEKQGIITFSKLNKYYLLPFICPIFCMLERVFRERIGEQLENNNDDIFLTSIIPSLSYILGGLLSFIPSLSIKPKHLIKDALVYEVNEESKNMELVYKTNYISSKIKSKKVIFYYLLLSIFSSITISVNRHIQTVHLIEIRMYVITFIPIFSKIILKQNIYRHQYFSLFLSYIGFFFISIINILKIETSDIKDNILLFIAYTGFSLNSVLIKNLTDNYYVSPFSCLLFEGIGSLILIIIFNIVYSLVTFEDLSIITNITIILNFSSKLFYLFLYLFIDIIYEILTVLVIYYFSPILLMVSDIISPILYFTFGLIINKEKVKLLNIIFHYLGYFIVLICALIYNELIIFNCFELNIYTKKYICEREKLELYLIEKENIKNNISESEEDN